MASDLAIRFFSLNVRGIRAKNKRKTVFDLLKRNKYDAICLQESYITKEVSEDWKKEWGGELMFSVGTAHSGGLVILLRKGFSCSCDVIYESERLLAVNVDIGGKSVVVINAYAPNTIIEKNTFFEKTIDVINNLRVDDLILCGDFNCVLNNNMDIISGEKHAAGMVEKFNDVLNRCDLQDVWRLFHLDEKEYTWSKRNPFIARRLDYVLSSSNVFDKVINCDIVSVPMSDHRGCLLVLKFTDTVRGPGYWKFNNSLLQDLNFVNQMNDVIEDYFLENSNDDDFQMLWELLKLRIKDFCISYSTMKSIERKNNLMNLYNKLNAIDIEIGKKPDCLHLQGECERIKLEIELLEQYKARAAQTRARVKWIESGEKNTKYFLNLEKSKANGKIMDCVKNENGNIVTKQSDIMKVQQNYFANLYKKKVDGLDMTDKIDRFLNNTSLPNLLQEQRDCCEGEVSVGELLSALKQMKNGSAPGNDGITIEFLKCFWSRIQHLVTASFNFAFVSGSLSLSQRRAIITLIHKGKDLPRNELGNWRPISLTNSDYKLLAKCLALRLNTVIRDLVSEDQVGYIKGRSVSTLLRLIDDVSDHLNEQNKPGLLVTVDYTQAFDSISKDFMLCAFEKFGFGPDFLQWVRILMSDAESCIQYCGWMSEFFKAESGIRQGCPFSPLAFILAVEILAIKIKDVKDIKGIRTHVDEFVKITLYADDITLFLSDENEMHIALDIISQFSVFSGLYMNKRKSEAMWLGSKKNCTDTFFDFVWKKQLKILGVYFSNDKCASMVAENWTNRLENVKRLIVVWEKRNLSIIGKICIVKTFLLSQFVYVMQALVVPDKVLTELNCLLFRFLWRKKDCNRRAFEKVKRTVVCNNFENGGLNMIDVRQMQVSFLLQWVVRCCNAQPHEKWSVLPTFLFSHLGLNNACFYSNVKSSTFRGFEYVKSFFWRTVLKTWLDNNRHNTDDSVCTLLWNNVNVMYAGNVLFFPDWIAGGYMHVNDVTDLNGFYSYKDICAVLGNSPSRILEYTAVRAAVARFIAKFSCNVAKGKAEDFPLFNSKRLLKSREFRQELVAMKSSQPCSVGFWKRKFNIEIDDSYWAIANNSTCEVRLLVLHWKILHNIYPTNILLCKMKVRENNKCFYCNDIVDVVEHFFFHCPVIKKFWLEVEQFIRIYVEANIKLGVSDVLFGITHFSTISKDKLKKINHIILIAKMCVSIFKKTESVYSPMTIFERQLALRKV